MPGVRGFIFNAGPITSIQPREILHRSLEPLAGLEHVDVPGSLELLRNLRLSHHATLR